MRIYKLFRTRHRKIWRRWACLSLEVDTNELRLGLRASGPFGWTDDLLFSVDVGPLSVALIVSRHSPAKRGRPPKAQPAVAMFWPGA